MQKQRKSDVPPTLSVFLQNKLCYISKRHCSIFLVGLTFGTMVLSICNKQKTADLVTGIVLKSTLRWTPGVFITPGTYHTKKKCPRAQIWSGENSRAGFAGEHKISHHRTYI